MSKYHKGDKFIVEIKEVMNSDNGTLYRSNFKTLLFDDYGLDILPQAITPAEDGLVDKAEVDEAYNKGLNDAWELARKVGTIDGFGLSKIFGVDEFEMNEDEEETAYSLVMKMTPRKALAKLEAYEKVQNEIKVGDIVDCYGIVGIVTKIEEGYLHTICKDGSYAKLSRYIAHKKTGKFIDLTDLFKQIGGAE